MKKEKTKKKPAARVSISADNGTSAGRCAAPKPSSSSSSSSSSVRVLIAVFPGVVPGPPPADRRRRLGAIADAWMKGRVPHASYHGVDIDFVFVEDRVKPDRDAGFASDNDPMSSNGRRFLNVTAKEGEFGLPSSPSAKDDLFAAYRVLFAAYFSIHHSDGAPPVYDWLFAMHDHAVVLPMNLACYVRRLQRSNAPHEQQQQQQLPFAAGSVLQIDAARNGTRFISDAAGLLLNRAAVQRLVATTCAPLAKWHREGPTHRIAECLMGMGVELTPALDASNGAELMNVYPPVRVVHGNTDPWYDAYKANAGLLRRGGNNNKKALSLSPITFHYVDAAEASAIAAIVAAAKLGGDEVCLRTEKSPLSRREIFDMYPDAAAAGAYSRPLSSASDPTIAYLSNVAKKAWRCAAAPSRHEEKATDSPPAPGPLANSSDDP